MKAIIARRIAALEQRQGSGGRKIHFVKATDEVDRERQVAELLASGIVGQRDGFVCLTGMSRVH